MRIILSVIVLCMAAAMASAAPREQVRQWTDQQLDALVELYQHFHRNPELSNQEQQTAGRIAEELRALEIEVTAGVGGHGVVGVLRNGEGPTVMLRGDMDALPVVEKTGLVYASTATTQDADGVEVGVMHACGHDVHVSNLIGVARYLAAHRDQWRGTVLLVAQPAEEIGAGALAMLEAGLFERFPRPDFALAIHVDATRPAGVVSYRAGPAMANVDSAEITMIGRGGHGSAPQDTVDPIVMAAQLVLDLQTIVSREVSPLDAAVVTVGAIHGGTKNNVIPDSCELKLTVRSHDEQVRDSVLEAIQRKAQATARSHRAPEPQVKISRGTPALINDEALVERLLPVLRRVVGEQNVVQGPQVMGGEDFGRYGRAGVPIFMYRVGSVDPQRHESFKSRGERLPSLHSSQYYPAARETLRVSLTTMVEAVLELLPPDSDG